MPAKTEYKGLTADTRRLLVRQEGRNVDFKLEPKAVSSELLVAFANASGGTILVGVSELENDQGLQSGEVVGCEVGDNTKLLIANRAASCRPSITIEIQVENSGSSKPIMRIDVPEGQQKPYATDSGRYVIRSEARNVSIDPPLMKAMILKAEADEFVSRFKQASEELIAVLQRMEENLSERIAAVEAAAERAHEAAIDAQDAAREAGASAEEAASAAMDY